MSKRASTGGGKNKATRPRVYARVRPMFGRDAGQEELFTITDTSLEYQKEPGADVSKFNMDRVFGMDSTQEEVYDTIGKQALEALQQGYNSTIMAYGQTGSGKTFSMEGAKDANGVYQSRGLIPRIFTAIFETFSQDPGVKAFEVSMQFIELYNEQLQDLFGKRKVVDVTMDPTGGYRCKDAVHNKAKDAEDALKIYNDGCKMRATASTKMNESSSRSHALLIVQVNWSSQKGKHFAALNLVDLAGSEGMKKTGATGANAREGIKINLSLGKLALVVKCLSEGASHVPYRESKLTMMLQKGLGGNNMLHIILALSNSAEQVAEGTACLRFGQSCLSMTVNPNANAVEKEQAEMRAVIKEQMSEIAFLTEETERLKAELAERKSIVDASEVPDFLVAKHIALNKDALTDDLNDAVSQIEELKKAVEAKRAEAEALANGEYPVSLDSQLGSNDNLLAGLDAQARAEAMEARNKEMTVQRMRMAAHVDQEKKAFEAELAQMLEIQAKLQTKLSAADSEKARQEEASRLEAEEKAEEEVARIEAKAAKLEAELKEREEAAALLHKDQEARAKELQEQLEAREDLVRKEQEARAALEAASAADNQKMKEELERMQREREAQEAEIEATKKEKERLAAVEAEAERVKAQSAAQEAEMAAELGSMMEQLAEQKALIEAQREQANARKALEVQQAEAAVQEVQSKAAALEAQLKEREEQEAALAREAAEREAMLQAQLEAREELMRKEQEARRALEEETQAGNQQMKEELERMKREREAQEAEIEATKKEKERMAHAEAAAEREKERATEMEKELAQMKEVMAAQQSHLETARAAAGGDTRSTLTTMGGLYKPVPEMLRIAAKKLERKAVSAKIDPAGVHRVLDTLPVLVACNDLRALCELEPANKTLFQDMGGIVKMIDYLMPYGAQAPYATHIARTLPVVMDANGRKLFNAYASSKDSSGTVRLCYLSALLTSTDPDDKENACVAIAAIATDSPENRLAFFEHKIAHQVMDVMKELAQAKMPRQRLQRVAVMALSELAQDFEPFQRVILESGGVQMLLKQANPQANDPFVIKETITCVGRITQGNKDITAELNRANAIAVYSQLLFAQMHDTAITELAALALVNLIAEAPDTLEAVMVHPRYTAILYEMLASMARALASSMIRQRQTSAKMAGSDTFRFWGASAVGEWGDGTAGGDRTHTSFADNPQFLLRAPQGTRFSIVLYDTLEDKRQRDRGKSRPLFLRLCVTEAGEEVLGTREKNIDINASGNLPAPADPDSVVQLEPKMNGFIDVAKTREITMRCFVKTAAKDDAWIIVPHVGCSHLHSRYTIAVFADREVTLEGELQAWQKRVVVSSWSPLCSASKGISDARWRNCPQFQLINMGPTATVVRALLSYGERDEFLNSRYLKAVESDTTLDEKPMLSMYVMKNNVPDKRYVGTLSPQVDNYVAHSLVTNSWCVQCRLTLEPDSVYALLVVMADGTSSLVPLRITLYSSPELEEGTVVAKTMSPASEWYLTVLIGVTDANGCNTIELTPQDSLQATLVFEAQDSSSFCSISTTTNAVPHKQTPTYAQKQAVLSVPFTAGSSYSMVTRCITQRQEPIRNSEVKILLYSTRPLTAVPNAGQQLQVDEGAAAQMLSRSTSDAVSYGSETLPPDLVRQASTSSEDADKGHDPKVMEAVVLELEAQRDNLYSFTRSTIDSEPPKVLETLRKHNEDLSLKSAELTKEVESLRALTSHAELNKLQRQASQRGLVTANLKRAALQAEVTKRKAENTELQQTVDRLSQRISVFETSERGSAGDALSGLDALQEQCDAQKRENAELRKQLAAGGGGGGAAASSAEISKLQSECDALKTQLMAAQRDAAVAELNLNKATAGGGGDSAEIARLKRENDELRNSTKSAACVLQ